jgi:hypothetical protein
VEELGARKVPNVAAVPVLPSRNERFPVVQQEGSVVGASGVQAARNAEGSARGVVQFCAGQGTTATGDEHLSVVQESSRVVIP